MLVAMVISLIDSSTQCAVVCETSLSSTKLVISLRRSPETTTSNKKPQYSFKESCFVCQSIEKASFQAIN